MNLNTGNEQLNLALSGSAVLLGLLWMFFGVAIMAFLVNGQNQQISYYFFSGLVFSLSISGLYNFIRSALYYSEVIITDEQLTSIMYENYLDDEDEGVFLKDKLGIYKLINPLAIKVLNLQGKKVIDATDRELYKPGTANKFAHEDQLVLESGETIIWETSKNTGHGDDTYLCKKIPCIDKKGRIIGIIGTCKNITILKSFQNLNLQLEERYRNLFNKLPYPVLVLDSSSLLPFTFNNAMNNLLEYTADEFSRMRISLHVDPDKLNKFQQSLTHINHSHGGEFETKLITKQRDAINITGYAQEIIIDDKSYLHILLYDNTETKKSTEELIGSELKYRSLFEHANDAIIVVSTQSLNIIDANEIAISFLGFMRNDLLLMSIHDLDAAVDQRITQSKIADLEIYNHALYEHEIRDRKGNRLSVEINAHKLNYGNEDVYQFVIRNISARKKTEVALISSENRYRQMFESNMAIKLVIDPEKFCIENANHAAEEFYGYPIEELKGMDLSQINILSRDKLNILIKQTREQSLGFYSCPHRLKNGEIRFVEVRDGPMEIEGKQLFYSIIYDVTTSKEAENQILVASKMFDYSTDAVMLINDDNKVASVNHAFTQITGYPLSEVQNHSPELILANKNEYLLSDKVYKSIEEKGQWQGEIWHRLKNGQSKALNVSINCVRNENTKASSYVVILSPKNKNTSEHKDNIRFVDLTELPNKPLFVDRLKNAINRAQRNKNKLGIILIDFKNFSQINKKYSYEIGDKLLKAISKRLKYNTRDSDTISHFSSDDFAVLIENLGEIQEIGIVAQKLLSTLSEAYQTADHVIELQVSMGISIYPDDNMQADELINCAQAALQAAQLHGSKNNFELTSPEMNEKAKLWLQTEANLHGALRQNQFDIHYLPQVDTNKKEIDAIEALIRWQHPSRGELAPIDFLPDAEKTGFIGAIGINVIEQAFQQFQLWCTQKIAVKRININICQSQLDADLVNILIEKCKKYGLQTNQIGLEFSEQHFVNTTEEQRQILNDLLKHKFYIYVDDFGASNFSLNCLLQCNINAIKLDKSLIKKSLSSSEAKNLIKGIVALCQSQNIEIIAEHVETKDDYDYLQSFGIHKMQGYYFSAALPPDKITHYIETFK